MFRDLGNHQPPRQCRFDRGGGVARHIPVYQRQNPLHILPWLLRVGLHTSARGCSRNRTLELSLDSRVPRRCSSHRSRQHSYPKGTKRPCISAFRAMANQSTQGSELSPRIHYFIANLFIDAGFPPGVLNFILHRPEDAPEVIDVLIQHPAVRKINFTGSTAVGQIIAQKAGRELKPVLLELGGKNCSLILKDADMARAAEAAIEGSTLNVCHRKIVLYWLVDFLTCTAPLLLVRTDMHGYRPGDHRERCCR